MYAFSLIECVPLFLLLSLSRESGVSARTEIQTADGRADVYDLKFRGFLMSSSTSLGTLILRIFVPCYL